DPPDRSHPRRSVRDQRLPRRRPRERRGAGDRRGPGHRRDGAGGRRRARLDGRPNRYHPLALGPHRRCRRDEGGARGAARRPERGGRAPRQPRQLLWRPRLRDPARSTGLLARRGRRGGPWRPPLRRAPPARSRAVPYRPPRAGGRGAPFRRCPLPERPRPDRPPRVRPGGDEPLAAPPAGSASGDHRLPRPRRADDDRRRGGLAGGGAV
ncbi:MAG: MBL-fold metallo-hydrolase superfamily, partial [uncultured Thermomicrobiales bacterium]